MDCVTNHLKAQYCDWLQQHQALFWKVARSFADLPADQADLVQEIQLQLWRAMASFRGEAKPSTFIYRIGINTALAWRRFADRRGHGLHDSTDGVPMLAATDASPDEDLGRRDLIERLYVAIRALPKVERSLVLMYLDGLSYGEIAQVTGMTENHVGVALTRARKKLTLLMKGVTDELE